MRGVGEIEAYREEVICSARDGEDGGEGLVGTSPVLIKTHVCPGTVFLLYSGLDRYGLPRFCRDQGEIGGGQRVLEGMLWSRVR